MVIVLHRSIFDRAEEMKQQRFVNKDCLASRAYLRVVCEVEEDEMIDRYSNLSKFSLTTVPKI